VQDSQLPLLPPDAFGPRELLERARQAQLAREHQSRDRPVEFDDAMIAEAVRRAEQKIVRRAIEQARRAQQLQAFRDGYRPGR
jgi:hypothetical protein